MSYALTPNSCTVSGPSALHRSDGRPPIAVHPSRLPVRCHAPLSGRQAAWALANLSRNPNNKMKIISLGAVMTNLARCALFNQVSLPVSADYT